MRRGQLVELEADRLSEFRGWEINKMCVSFLWLL